MAPTRRRNSGSRSPDGDGSEPEEERPPKVRRISDGSTVGSTDGGATAGSLSTDHDEEDENMADALPQGNVCFVPCPIRLQRIVDELRVELEQFRELDDLEEQIVILEERVVWAQVEKSEEALAQLGHSLQEKRLEIRTLKERVVSLEQAISALAERKEEIKAGLDAEVAKIERLRDEARQRAKDFKEAQDPLVPLRCRREELKDEKSQKTEEKDHISERLKSAREEAKRRASDERERTLHHEILQDLSSVTASDTCKIIKMQPPRKGDHNQTTLEEPFGASAS